MKRFSIEKIEQPLSICLKLDGEILSSAPVATTFSFAKYVEARKQLWVDAFRSPGSEVVKAGVDFLRESVGDLLLEGAGVSDKEISKVLSAGIDPMGLMFILRQPHMPGFDECDTAALEFFESKLPMRPLSTLDGGQGIVRLSMATSSLNSDNTVGFRGTYGLVENGDIKALCDAKEFFKNGVSCGVMINERELPGDLQSENTQEEDGSPHM